MRLASQLTYVFIAFGCLEDHIAAGHRSSSLVTCYYFLPVHQSGCASAFVSINKLYDLEGLHFALYCACHSD